MHEGLQRVKTAGVGWVRFSVSWREIEADSGRQDWSGPDAAIAAANRNGVRVLAVLSGTPYWASSAPDSVLAQGRIACGSSKYSKYPPRSYDTWQRFVGEATTRYRGKVAAWEVWNEPDLGSGDTDARPCRFWCGSPAEYAKLLAAASMVIRSRSPETPVVLGGLALVPPDTGFLRAILTDRAYPAARFFDIANIHYYRDTNTIASTVTHVRETLRAGRAGERRLWVTETGTTSNQGEQQQAEFLARVVPRLLDAGIERVFWWRLFERPRRTTPGPCGNVPPNPGFALLRPAGEPKLAFFALERLALPPEN